MLNTALNRYAALIADRLLRDNRGNVKHVSDAMIREAIVGKCLPVDRERLANRVRYHMNLLMVTLAD